MVMIYPKVKWPPALFEPPQIYQHWRICGLSMHMIAVGVSQTVVYVSTVAVNMEMWFLKNGV